MNSKHLSMLAGAVGLAAAAVPGAANALVSWTFNTQNCVSTMGPSGHCGSGDNNFADSRTYRGTNGAGDVTVSGWGNTTGGNTLLERGDITHYGPGLGVRNADYNSGDSNEGNVPEHAIDNEERFDLVLFDFGDQLIQLSAVTLGYYSNDSDISVLAYTGEGSSDLSARRAWAGGEDLTSNGWSLIGNHDVDNGGDLTQEVNADSVVSSQWLVSAYNPAFGNSNCSICQADYEDYFKLLTLAGEVRQPPVTVTVPEPSTLLLVAGALPLLLRRRAKA